MDNKWVGTTLNSDWRRKKQNIVEYKKQKKKELIRLNKAEIYVWMCVCCMCLCLFVGFHSLPVTYQYSNGTKLYIARADAISLVAHNPGSNGILLQMICDVDPVQLPRHFVLGLSMCAPVTCFEPSVRGLINERHNHPQSTWCSFLTVIFLANTLFFRLRIRLQKKAKKKDRRPRLY